MGVRKTSSKWLKRGRVNTLEKEAKSINKAVYIRNPTRARVRYRDDYCTWFCFTFIRVFCFHRIPSPIWRRHLGLKKIMHVLLVPVHQEVDFKMQLRHFVPEWESPTKETQFGVVTLAFESNQDYLLVCQFANEQMWNYALQTIYDTLRL